MKVCVTGGRGFLGSAVCAELKERRVDVRELGRREGDLSVPRTSERLIQGADVVVHLAADVGGVGYLRSRAGQSFHLNFQLGLNVIKAALACGVQRVIMAGTPCAYSGDAEMPLTEDALLCGVPSGDTGNYGYAKLASSLVANHFCLPEGIDIATVIPSNLYGPGDNYDNERGHVVAALLRKAIIASQDGTGQFSVWGDGSATRDFVYVGDVAKAIADVVLAPQPHSGATYNLGSGAETSIRSISNEVAKAVGNNVQPHFEADKPVGYSRRVMSIEYARQQLAYTPSTSLQNGLKNTVDWLWQTGTVAQWLGSSQRRAA